MTTTKGLTQPNPTPPHPLPHIHSHPVSRPLRSYLELLCTPSVKTGKREARLMAEAHVVRPSGVPAVSAGPQSLPIPNSKCSGTPNILCSVWGKLIGPPNLT